MKAEQSWMVPLKLVANINILTVAVNLKAEISPKIPEVYAQYYRVNLC